MLAWEHTLIHREDYHVVEVEATGFEHSHNLETMKWFALKGYCNRRNRAANEIEERVLVHCDVVFGNCSRENGEAIHKLGNHTHSDRFCGNPAVGKQPGFHEFKNPVDEGEQHIACIF